MPAPSSSTPSASLTVVFTAFAISEPLPIAESEAAPQGPQEEFLPSTRVEMYVWIPDTVHMKTTLDIPSDLLNEAVRVSGARTKREAVLRALEEMNRRARMARLMARLGNSETFMDAGELARLRSLEVAK
jgi:Arc/MetJ family transcription regulator